MGINQGTDSGKAAFITALYVVIVPIYALFLKKRAPINVYLGVAIATVGFYLLCIDVGSGFSIQPSLLYHQKGANITNEVAQNMGFIELPVSVQWGPDLLVFRPFLDVTPYIGYALSNEVTTSLADFKFSSWQGKERFEYGLGIGAGINVWKLQVIARYNWNFGSLYNVEGWDDIKSELKGLSAENENFGGVTLSLAFLF
jgi:hypothetical protein